ncbi:MAG: flagellar export protein FliJ [Treponema sp.]|nr:flagellar export protein FliJ [Treponema sp.]
MKKFHYSLQKILDLRDFELKQAEMELGKVNAKIAQFQNQLKMIAEQKFSAQREMDASNDISFFGQGHNYMLFLEQKKDYCLQNIATLQIEAEKRKDVVRKAMQKEKVLERLKESKIKTWKYECLKAEELVTDDVVTSKYNKNNL